MLYVNYTTINSHLKNKQWHTSDTKLISLWSYFYLCNISKIFIEHWIVRLVIVLREALCLLCNANYVPILSSGSLEGKRQETIMLKSSHNSPSSLALLWTQRLNQKIVRFIAHPSVLPPGKH